MKATGVVRRIDDLGRVVIPKEIRKFLDMTEGVDEFEIYMQDDCIVLKKYEPACIFCESANDVVNFMDKRICRDCIAKLSAE